MNDKTTTLTITVRLSGAAAAELADSAGKLSLTTEEMASAILDGEFPLDPLGDDERGMATLAQVRTLYPERWPSLRAVYHRYASAYEQRDASDRSQVATWRAETISLTLPPPMVTFMCETEELFPELWSIFYGECFEAVLPSLPHYLDNAFSFESPKDRREAFQMVEEARKRYVEARTAITGAEGRSSRA